MLNTSPSSEAQFTGGRKVESNDLTGLNFAGLNFAAQQSAVETLPLSDGALRDIEIVFLTSLLSQQETRKGLVSRGGKLFLAKPVDPPVLIRCIEMALGHIPGEARCAETFPVA
jgi:CheY-like chemotaxis protein